MEIIAQRNREIAIYAAFTSLIASVTEDPGPDRVMDTLAGECRRLLPVDSTEVFLPGLWLEGSEEVEAGPALESFESGKQVDVKDLAPAASRWPDYVERTTAQGYGSVFAIPMRFENEIVGSFTLLSVGSKGLSDEDQALGQALTDVAAQCLLRQRELRHYKLLSSQLQTALDSRIIIEQAKGVLAERAGVSVSAAFQRMRAYARGSNRKLADVAHGVVDGSLRTDAFLRSRRGGNCRIGDGSCR